MMRGMMREYGKDRVARVLDWLDRGGPRPDDDEVHSAILLYELDAIERTGPGAIDWPSLRNTCATCFKLLTARPPEFPPKTSGLVADMHNLKMVGYAAVAGRHLDEAAALLAAAGRARAWDRALVRGAAKALLSLARGDPKSATRMIDSLRAMQAEREDQHMERRGEWSYKQANYLAAADRQRAWQYGTANYLMAMYHVAAAIDAAARHRLGEQDGDICGRLDGHFRAADVHCGRAGDRTFCTSFGVLRAAAISGSGEGMAWAQSGQ